MVRGNFGLHLLQMGHQEGGAVKKRIGKGQLLDGEVGGSLKVAAADYKVASCNDECRLDEKPSHCIVITSFLYLFSILRPSHC